MQTQTFSAGCVCFSIFYCYKETFTWNMVFLENWQVENIITDLGCYSFFHQNKF